jgi:hypothetical protein
VSLASEVEFMCCSPNLTRIGSTECPANVPKGARTKEAKPMERGQREQYVLPQLQPRQRQRLIAAEEVPSVPPRRTEKNNMVSDSCFLFPGGGSPPVLAISSITLSGPRTSGKNEPRNAACTIVQLVVQLTQKQKESVAQFRIRTRDPSSCNRTLYH